MLSDKKKQQHFFFAKSSSTDQLTMKKILETIEPTPTV